MKISPIISLYEQASNVFFMNCAELAKIEAKYSCPLPLEINIILSIKDRFIDVNENRVLRIMNADEILNANKELHVDFIEKGFIPIVDMFDNDFLVFSIHDLKYYTFNINDESIFNQYESMYSFFKDQL